VVEGEIQEYGLFGQVYAGSENVGAELCRQGLAQVTGSPIDIDTSDVPKLMEAEWSAQESRIGIHAEVLPEIMEFEQNYHIRLDKETGVVEKILNNCKFLVSIPSRRLLVKVGLNGVSPREEFAKEAKEFCRLRFHQRDIEFEVANFDKAHIAYSNIELPDSGVNVTDLLLERGFVARSSYKAPASAMVVRTPTPLEMNIAYPVHILTVVSPVEMIVQSHSDEMMMIQDMLLKATPAKLSKVEKNEIVIALNGGNRFRAVVEAVRDDEVDVMYIDYGIKGVTDKDNLFETSDEVKNVRAQARTVFLGCLNANSDDTDYIMSLCRGSVIYMHLMYTVESKEYVLLTDREDLQGGSLHSMVLNEGLAKLNDVKVNGKFLDLWSAWKEIECL
jgi:hypothetical protein